MGAKSIKLRKFMRQTSCMLLSVILQINLAFSTLSDLNSFNFSTELKSCEPLQVPANGTMHGNDSTHGAKILFSCLTGFNLFGLRTLTCNNGEWSRSVPSCKGMRQFLLALI